MVLVVSACKSELLIHNRLYFQNLISVLLGIVWPHLQDLIALFKSRNFPFILPSQTCDALFVLSSYFGMLGIILFHSMNSQHATNVTYRLFPKGILTKV